MNLLKLFKRKKKQPTTDPIEIAVKSVNQIKEYVESEKGENMGKLIDAVIPGDQKELIYKARKAIAFVAELLGLASKKVHVVKEVAQNEQLTEAVLMLRAIKKEERGGLYDQLAGQIASELTGELYDHIVVKTREKYKNG